MVKNKQKKSGLPLYKLSGTQVFVLLVFALFIGGFLAAKSCGMDFFSFIQLWL